MAGLVFLAVTLLVLSAIALIKLRRPQEEPYRKNEALIKPAERSLLEEPAFTKSTFEPDLPDVGAETQEWTL
jgi:hypothetical protein